MSDDEIISLLKEIQRAIDGKNLTLALQYYHPDIIYVGPAFPAPVHGKEALEQAFGRHFNGPQRTTVVFKEVRIHHISDTSFVVYCLVGGNQTLHMSSRWFKGWLSRVFVDTETDPRIVHEHFSLAQ